MNKLVSSAEPLRTILEYTELKLKYSYPPPARTPKTLLVLPGLFSSNLFNSKLISHLKNRGHDVRGWKYGINTGLHDSKILEISNTINKPTVIIGHSLGGIYAREIAKINPYVDSVYCLGTPVFFTSIKNSPVSKAYLLLNPDPAQSQQKISEPPSVNTTMVYSRSDGVVPWQNCINETTNNIEVSGSHCGMVLNLQVFGLLDLLLP